MLMAVVAISRDGKLFGIHIPKEGEEEESVEAMTVGDDGTVIINTTPLTKNMIGFSGTTPVEITVSDNRITKVKPLANNETPEFYGAVVNSDLLDSWNGKTLEEAAKIHPDATTGATITSTALIRNVEAGIGYALNTPIAKSDSFSGAHLDFKFFCVIAIILAASILPLLLKGKLYRYIQLTLNVILLGFWGGTFISYSLMTSLMANGIKTWLMIPVLIMLVTAFLYPFFGKNNYYCSWICPYGSLQELAGKCIPFKLKISARTAKTLSWTRDALWFLLMWFMWTGLWFDWMDWEPFAAFFFQDASPIVLGIAGGFFLLSFIIRRPYCRFVCPTGTLFKISEGLK